MPIYFDLDHDLKLAGALDSARGTKLETTSASIAKPSAQPIRQWCLASNRRLAAGAMYRVRHALLAVMMAGEAGLATAEESRAGSTLTSTSTAGNPTAVTQSATPAPTASPIVVTPIEQSAKPRTFDKRITDRLGVKNVAYLLAVDVNGKVTPFVSADSKATYRVIDPSREKLTMDLFEIEPFTIVAGKRNPFCVLFIGGSGRKLWMEACP